MNQENSGSGDQGQGEEGRQANTGGGLPSQDFDWDRTEEFLIAHWQKLAGIVVLVFLGIWLVHEFRTVQEKRQNELAQRFAEVQKIHQRSLEKDAANKAPRNASPDAETKAEPNASDSKAVVEENIKAIKRESQDGFYEYAAQIYSALVGLDPLNPESVSQRLPDLRRAIEKLPAGDELLSDEVLVRDSARLLLARLLLSTGRDDDRAEGRKLLEELAGAKTLVSGEAVIVLARTARDEAEKANAKAKAGLVVQNDPAQREIIQAPLAQVGISI